MGRNVMKAAMLLALTGGYWAVASVAEAATGKKAQRTSTRNVADFQDAPSMTGGIQEAIDSLPATGGMEIVKYDPAAIKEDWFSIISNNVIYRNREVGIHAHTSYGFVITGNIVKDNGEGICLHRAQRTIVSNNHCFDHRGYYGAVTTQSWGIMVSGSENVISNNICAGNRLGGILWSGRNNEIHGNVGKVVKKGSK